MIYELWTSERAVDVDSQQWKGNRPPSNLDNWDRKPQKPITELLGWNYTARGGPVPTCSRWTTVSAAVWFPNRNIWLLEDILSVFTEKNILFTPFEL